jgi:cytochrome c
MVAASKFASMPDFGKNTKGHIALQAHGEAMWYRNVKVRELD